MGDQRQISELAAAFAALDDVAVARLVQSKVESGVDPLSIVQDLQSGMAVFGESCQKGDYFISDLILAGDIFQQSMRVLQPHLAANARPDGSVKIVLGTVKGDIHNLGKDILGLLLSASGFEVFDVGINAAPSAFVEKLSETGAPLLGLSGLITPSFEAMKATIESVAAAGLRQRVKVIIGGGVVNQMVQEYAGADAFSTDALEGVSLCKKLAAEVAR